MKQSKSNKQSGGLTANDVNIYGDFHMQSQPTGKPRSRLKTIATVGTIIVSVIAILSYLGLKPKNMDQQTNPSQNVESNKQSGGITANEVNINMPANEYDKFHVDVSPMATYKSLYRRTVKVRNNTKYPQNNVHISIAGTEEILHSGHPVPEGGGTILVNYIKSEGKVYETEIDTIPTQKYVVIELASPKPFEVDVKI
ncbi:hypothetical protein HZC21_02460, partial [Candidatus Peregrinibacteria bacterium]|nr:hypothetical protein [Candidatus Peregrinibacteria bacterium]